jgi:hypothetical protein
VLLDDGHLNHKGSINALTKINREEARRIAADIAKLPDLLRKS